MKKKIFLLTISILLLTLVIGCAQDSNLTETVAATATSGIAGSTEEAAGETEPVGAATAEPDENAEDMETEIPTEMPTVPAEPVAPFTLNEQVYVSPSNAFTVNLPQNWNCSETGQYRVDCHNNDNTGTIIVRAIGTGYELPQDNFLTLVQAELVSQYDNVKAYTEISREASEGAVINQATWQEGDVAWQGIDRFLRSGPAVFYVTLACSQDRFSVYQPIFDEFYQTAKFSAGAMSGADLYPFRKDYVSHANIFKLQVPTSWYKFADTSMDRTEVEGFTSPDGRAGVQVAIFAKGSHISQDTKSAKTLEIMRKLYGWDLRVSTDKALKDGREQLEWTGTRKGIEGITYFDDIGTNLYIFSLIWEPSTQNLYKPVLDEIAASFTYE